MKKIGFLALVFSLFLGHGYGAEEAQKEGIQGTENFEHQEDSTTKSDRLETDPNVVLLDNKKSSIRPLKSYEGTLKSSYLTSAKDTLVDNAPLLLWGGGLGVCLLSCDYGLESTWHEMPTLVRLVGDVSAGIAIILSVAPGPKRVSLRANAPLLVWGAALGLGVLGFDYGLEYVWHEIPTIIRVAGDLGVGVATILAAAPKSFKID